jgi:hypothetical protein
MKIIKNNKEEIKKNCPKKLQKKIKDRLKEIA